MTDDEIAQRLTAIEGAVEHLVVRVALLAERALSAPCEGLLTVREVAARYRVSPEQVRADCASGLLPAISRRGRGGHDARYIRPFDAESLYGSPTTPSAASEAP